MIPLLGASNPEAEAASLSCAVDERGGEEVVDRRGSEPLETCGMT